VSTVDLVVVSYNSAGELRRCVSSLAGEPDVSAFVVDNASSDGSLETIADLDVTQVAQPGNYGFAHGCNAGWRRGHSPYVLLLNPDATMDGDALRRLVAVADADPAIGLAAPRIVEPDGTLDPSQRRFPRIRSTFAQALFLHRLFPHASWVDELVRDPARYEGPGSPDWVSGACMLIRRDVLERLGGLDEGFFLYGEDKDLCRRIRDLGYDIRFDPSVQATHEGGASAPRTSLLPVLVASRLRYARKHRSRAGAVAERAGIALGAVTHAVVTRGGAPARRGWLRALGRALRPRPPMGI
jgi:N-acetylglucosaminyl-diphospho-decaprenol L-rhamnosyltransferase